MLFRSWTPELKKDHLGSVKMTVDVNGTAQAWNDYYPYGMSMGGNRHVVASADSRYNFTGKERDVETGYDWFSPGRYYDSWAARWCTPDPLTSLHPDYTPYAYCYNNPISYIDPMGMDSSYYNSNNQYVYVNDAGKETVYESEAAAHQAWGEAYLENNGDVIYDNNSIIGKFNNSFKEALNKWATEDNIVDISNDKSGSVETLLNAKYSVERIASKGGGVVLPIIGIIEAGGNVVGNLLQGFTRHGLNQAISREGVGVSPQAILDALRNPITVEVGSGTKTLVGRDAIVVMNQAGQVITTWARNSNGIRIK